jgi:acetyltransferase-like isoleucine patch superfamily enzyme
MKSEKEKMLSGFLYKAHDEELVSERQSAKKKIFTYNNSGPLPAKERHNLLSSLLGKAGVNINIEPPFYCDYGYNIFTGDNFFANYNLIILDCASVIIGDSVLIGPSVGIYTAGHPVHRDLRNQGYEFALPVTIGDYVWIGGNVVINPGVTIGDNSVIGSGSVVTKAIPSNVIAAGNPCRVIREITDSDRNIVHQ